MAELVELGNHRCAVVTDGDGALATARAFMDLVGDALGEGASVVAIPVAALDESFFELSSGFAGEVLQKAVNYRLKVAIIGDVSAFTGRSRAFHDLVVESERSSGYFFLPDLDALATRLSLLHPTA